MYICVFFFLFERNDLFIHIYRSTFIIYRMNFHKVRITFCFQNFKFNRSGLMYLMYDVHA